MSVQGRDGTQVTPLMGSYGIGISRLVGAAIEASHDKDGIIWPDALAPYKAAILNLRADDPACTAAADALYAGLGEDSLYDDRDERGGAKFAAADLVGLPWQIVIGPKGVAARTVELKRRATGEKAEISAEDALARVMG